MRTPTAVYSVLLMSLNLVELSQRSCLTLLLSEQSVLNDFLSLFLADVW